MLKVSHLHAEFATTKVLIDLGFELSEGNILMIVGRNGAGKTTLLKCLMGLVQISSGSVELDGKRLDTMVCSDISGEGVGYAAQSEGLFTDLTVEQNMLVGQGPKDDALLAELKQQYPIIYERRNQKAGTLSGGEQQLVKLLRALTRATRLLLLDEPSQGLQANLLPGLIDILQNHSNCKKVMAIIAEQNQQFAREISDNWLVIENGRLINKDLPVV